MNKITLPQPDPLQKTDPGSSQESNPAQRPAPIQSSGLGLGPKIVPFGQLACPLDGDSLECDGLSWRCASGHCFDIARQGYTHLLPVQNMRSRNPGDSKEMIEARRSFLNAGFYQPIAAALNDAVLADLPADASCVDAGCGEGYYMRQLASAMGSEQCIHMLGLDISKPAIIAAAKQDKQPNWVVASNARLPILSGSIDRVICMFGFPVYSEFARVLKPNGQLLMVDSGPGHLRELREIIYPVVKTESTEPVPDPDGFKLLSSEAVNYKLTLSSAEQIAELLAMTPHLFRASAEGKVRVAALTSLSLSVDVRLTRFAPIAPATPKAAPVTAEQTFDWNNRRSTNHDSD